MMAYRGRCRRSRRRCACSSRARTRRRGSAARHGSLASFGRVARCNSRVHAVLRARCGCRRQATRIGGRVELRAIVLPNVLVVGTCALQAIGIVCGECGIAADRTVAAILNFENGLACHGQLAKSSVTRKSPPLVAYRNCHGSCILEILQRCFAAS